MITKTYAKWLGVKNSENKKIYQTNDNMVVFRLPKVVLMDYRPLNEDLGPHVRFHSFLLT